MAKDVGELMKSLMAKLAAPFRGEETTARA